MNNISETNHGKETFVDWLLEKTDILTNKWEEIMNAEQAGFNPDGSHVQSQKIQNIASSTQTEIPKCKNQLSELNLPPQLNKTKIDCLEYLDKWQSFFYFMSEYSKTENLDYFGAATKSYNTVEIILSKILSQLGIKTEKTIEASDQSDRKNTISGSFKEKEIIQIKQVLIKTQCPTCKTYYYETLAICPTCGSNRKKNRF